jgi:pyruvate/2-oxoglutarate dehydrogenase complex dihydrolipoamide dehydrogenase (E3) component
VSAPFPALVPFEGANRALAGLVRPEGWESPEPARRYDLVVIGAGTAGLVTAAAAAALGAKVALVERELLGGDCLNVGCVPSKALIRSARAAADARRAGRFGVRGAEGAAADFPAVMERMRALRARIARNDSAARFAGLGVHVFFGAARFVARDAVEVGGRRLAFAKACIATGARPAVPPVAGLAEAGFLTNVTLFSLTALPRRLAVIGGGPIGCELAQAFARLGAEVVLVEASERILSRESADASARVAAALAADGVVIKTASRVARVSVRGGRKVLHLDGSPAGGGSGELEADAILVGAGRAPNVEGLGLDVAGVAHDARTGVHVDARLRTTNRRIYAAGDVCSERKFTHVADATARIVVRNALFLGRASTRDLVVPWCTNTSPVVAHVGLYEHAARAAGRDVTAVRVELAELDRAVLDGEEDGFLEVVAARRSGKVLGATLVAEHAGETLSELTLAVRAGVTLGALADTIHPYPTQAEAVRRAGDMHRRTRLTPLVKRIAAAFLRLRRR